MSKLAAAILGACLLGACASDPLQGSRELLKAGNYEAALGHLLEARKKSGADTELHVTLFVLLRYLALQGEGAKSQSRSDAAMDEYRWIVAKEGIGSDFADMEKSLKDSEKTRAAYEAAYALVFTH